MHAATSSRPSSATDALAATGLRRCKEELEAEQAEQQASYYEDNLAWRAAWEAEHGRKLGGRKPTPPAPDALAKRRINTTDPDTRLLKRAGGRPVQGHNAQVVASPEQVIAAADITQQSNGSGQLAPMVASAGEALHEAGIEEPIGTVLADGGYWNSPQIYEVPEQGIDVLVPIENRTRTAPRTLSARQGTEAERSKRSSLNRGSSALPAKTADRRAGLRQYEVHPPRGPLPTSRAGGLQGRVAADRRGPQPLEALAGRPRGYLIPSGAPLAA